jgi:hypothetical protein
MNRHHHRLALSSICEAAREAGFCAAARSHLAEFFNVCARDKRAAGADYYRCLDRRVALISSIAAPIPSGTPGPSAFTGGLSMVMTATSLLCQLLRGCS